MPSSCDAWFAQPTWIRIQGILLHWLIRNPWKEFAIPAETTLLKHAVTSPRLQPLLKAHCFQGQSNDCGPYSAAMLIRAFRQPNLDPNILARELEHVRWIGPLPLVRRIHNWATFPWGVVDALRVHGIKSRWKIFSKPDDLRKCLAVGQIPIVFIGSWRPMWGHVMILAAYDPQKGWGFVDPGWPHPELHWVDESTFYRQWKAYAHSFIRVFP